MTAEPVAARADYSPPREAWLHEAADPRPAKQSNRNRPITCPSCGWSGRTYAKWIGKDGDDLPICNRKIDDAGTRCGTRLVLKATDRRRAGR